MNKKIFTSRLTFVAMNKYFILRHVVREFSCGVLEGNVRKIQLEISANKKTYFIKTKCEPILLQFLFSQRTIVRHTLKQVVLHCLKGKRKSW